MPHCFSIWSNHCSTVAEEAATDIRSSAIASGFAFSLDDEWTQSSAIIENKSCSLFIIKFVKPALLHGVAAAAAQDSQFGRVALFFIGVYLGGDPVFSSPLPSSIFTPVCLSTSWTTVAMGLF